MPLDESVELGQAGHLSDHDQIHAAINGLPTTYLSPAAANAAYVAKGDAQQAVVSTTETTTSGTYGDLATAGPSVTVTIGSSGRALVVLAAEFYNSGGAGQWSIMSFSVSGATTRAVQSGHESTGAQGNQSIRAGRSCIVSGLTAGSNTFTAKYVAAAGTAFFAGRLLMVTPL